MKLDKTLTRNWFTKSKKKSPGRRAPSSPRKMIKMLKGQQKHIDKEQSKTKHKAPRSVNYRATQNKNNIATIALERSVVYTTGVLKAFHCTNFTLGSRYNS